MAIKSLLLLLLSATGLLLRNSVLGQDCPRRGDGVDWTKKFDNCYSALYEKETYDECFLHCNNLKAQMLCIENQEQNDFLQSELDLGVEDTDLWVAINNFVNGNSMVWLSICKSTYFNYAAGQPNFDPTVQTGIVMQTVDGQFRAVTGSKPKYCMCQDTLSNAVAEFGDGDDDDDGSDDDNSIDLFDLWFVWFIIIPMTIIIAFLAVPLLIYYLTFRDMLRGKVLREFLGYDEDGAQSFSDTDICELPNGIRLGSVYGELSTRPPSESRTARQSNNSRSSSSSSAFMQESRSSSTVIK